MIISLDAYKAFEKNHTLLHNKSTGQTRDPIIIASDNIGSLQDAHSHHQPRWRETPSASTKIRTDKVVHSLHTYSV